MIAKMNIVNLMDKGSFLLAQDFHDTILFLSGFRPPIELICGIAPRAETPVEQFTHDSRKKEEIKQLSSLISCTALQNPFSDRFVFSARSFSVWLGRDIFYSRSTKHFRA